MNSARAYKVIGICDDETTCGFCGKTDLRRVVAFQAVDSDDVLFAGTTCAQTVKLIVLDEETGEAKVRTARQILTLAERNAREAALAESLERAAWSVAWILESWRTADTARTGRASSPERVTCWAGGYELGELIGEHLFELPFLRTREGLALVLGWARRAHKVGKLGSLARREALAVELHNWIEAMRLKGAAFQA